MKNVVLMAFLEKLHNHTTEQAQFQNCIQQFLCKELLYFKQLHCYSIISRPFSSKLACRPHRTDLRKPVTVSLEETTLSMINVNQLVPTCYKVTVIQYQQIKSTQQFLSMKRMHKEPTLTLFWFHCKGIEAKESLEAAS